MSKLIVIAVVVLLSFSSLVFQQERAALGIATTVVAEPQAKCQNGFIYIQFQGEEGWVQTMKKCDMRATPPKLDTTNARTKLTQNQLDALMNSYLSGHPLPQGKTVCCCQPGWRTYDSTSERCNWGKIVDK